MALGVVVALAGVSALAWRMRALPEPRGQRQPAPQGRAAMAGQPGQLLPPDRDAQVPRALPDATRDAPAGATVAARDAAPRMLPVAILSSTDAARPVGADDAGDATQPAAEGDVAAPAATDAASAPATADGGDAQHVDDAPADANADADADSGETGALADGDQPIDAQPPATADSMPVQQAWLQRIVELDAAGDTEGARQSLAVFRHRFPDVTIPDALRPLEP